MVDVTITRNVVGTGKLSLGAHPDWQWKGFRDQATRRQLAKDANLKLIRINEWRSQSGGSPDPCVHWDEATRTGTFNWSDLDSLCNAILSVGAEPLLCLGGYDLAQKYLPNGMATNPTTGLPYPESWATYCAQYVKHFKQVGLRVRFYQIVNEAEQYLGYSHNAVKLGNFTALFNACYTKMHQENPNILVSTDCCTRRYVLDYFLNNVVNLDCLDFHKYDAYDYPTEFSDAQMFERAETLYLTQGSSTKYDIVTARQKWFDAKGVTLPAMCSESNFNATYTSGTDPKIQQMTGAVWLALYLRMAILVGLAYTVYYEFSSSKGYGETTPSRGFGFGMINGDNNKPWYPYYVNWMVGRNLAVGDSILESNSASESVRVIAWNHHRKLNILLICKTAIQETVNLKGITGDLEATWIDETIPYTSPAVQTAVLNAENPITLNGYTVMLLQKTMPISPVTIAAALTITLIIIGGTYYFVTRRG